MLTFRNRLMLACLVTFSIETDAFVPHARRLGRASSSPSTTKTTQRALPVEHLADLTVTWDQIQQSASQFLADDATEAAITAINLAASDVSATVATDASSAAVAAANEVSAVANGASAAAGEATGWWGAYINIFKSTLLWLHGTIDGPLRSVGFDQTWGVSIALFTLLVRGLLVPLSIQQSQSSEYMKALKPYMAEIKKKFKNNQDAQNRAVAKLYEDAQQNPLSGCFLSLAQIPVFLGLYRGVRYLAFEGELDEPFLWIPSLAGPVSPPDFRGLDWLTQGWNMEGTPTPPLGWETTLAFMVMPVVLVVLQSATMRILQPPIDDNMSDDEKEQMESTQTLIKFLPLLIGFFSLQVPAGLTIYWFASNLFTVTQSLAVRAYFAANPPEIELPEYWDKTFDENADFAAMSPEERRKANEAGLRVGPTLSELVDESKFHVYVERRSFREETPAWQRVQEIGAPPLPDELKAWAKGTTKQPAETVEA